MELEELKVSWTELDDKLKKSEALNEVIVLEMMKNKAQVSISKLINMEYMVLLAAIIMFPRSVSKLINSPDVHLLDVVMRSVILVTFIIIIICIIYNIILLKRVDISKKISENIYNINKYNITRKRGGIIITVMLFIMLVLFLWIVALGGRLIAFIIVGSFVISIIAFIYWASKRSIHQKTIDSIIESFNEIKDLEDKD